MCFVQTVYTVLEDMTMLEHDRRMKGATSVPRIHEGGPGPGGGGCAAVATLVLNKREQMEHMTITVQIC